VNGGFFDAREQSCPRCANRRTVHIGDRSFCFNCRLQRLIVQRVYTQSVHRETAYPLLLYPFTLAEQARLAMYRAAV
jgi:hypothetical protein